MSTGTRTRLSITVACMLALAAAGALAGETSVAMTHRDASLQWGPCPPFLPEGCAIAVLHGNPAERNADILFRVPAGAVIASHTHTSAERMILLDGELTVTYEGEKPVKLTRGMYAWGPPKKPHSAVCGVSGDCVLFIAFEEPVDAIATAQ